MAKTRTGVGSRGGPAATRRWRGSKKQVLVLNQASVLIQILSITYGRRIVCICQPFCNFLTCCLDLVLVFWCQEVHPWQHDGFVAEEVKASSADEDFFFGGGAAFENKSIRMFFLTICLKHLVRCYLVGAERIGTTITGESGPQTVVPQRRGDRGGNCRPNGVAVARTWGQPGQSPVQQM